MDRVKSGKKAGQVSERVSGSRSTERVEIGWEVSDKSAWCDPV